MSNNNDDNKSKKILSFDDFGEDWGKMGIDLGDDLENDLFDIDRTISEKSEKKQKNKPKKIKKVSQAQFLNLFADLESGNPSDIQPPIPNTVNYYPPKSTQPYTEDQYEESYNNMIKIFKETFTHKKHKNKYLNILNRLKPNIKYLRPPQRDQLFSIYFKDLYDNNSLLQKALDELPRDREKSKTLELIPPFNKNALYNVDTAPNDIRNVIKGDITFTTKKLTSIAKHLINLYKKNPLERVRDYKKISIEGRSKQHIIPAKQRLEDPISQQVCERGAIKRALKNTSCAKYLNNNPNTNANTFMSDIFKKTNILPHNNNSLNLNDKLLKKCIQSVVTYKKNTAACGGIPYQRPTDEKNNYVKIENNNKKRKESDTTILYNNNVNSKKLRLYKHIIKQMTLMSGNNHEVNTVLNNIDKFKEPLSQIIAKWLKVYNPAAIVHSNNIKNDITNDNKIKKGLKELDEKLSEIKPT